MTLTPYSIDGHNITEQKTKNDFKNMYKQRVRAMAGR